MPLAAALAAQIARSIHVEKLSDYQKATIVHFNQLQEEKGGTRFEHLTLNDVSDGKFYEIVTAYRLFLVRPEFRKNDGTNYGIDLLLKYFSALINLILSLIHI